MKTVIDDDRKRDAIANFFYPAALDQLQLPPMKKAEEVFLIVRELSHPKENELFGGHFRWKTWYDACVAVMRPSKHQLQSAFKSTVGNMLRAQVKAGTIVRTQRGQYSFSDRGRGFGYWQVIRPAHPLYVCAGSFRMRTEDLGKPRHGSEA